MGVPADQLIQKMYIKAGKAAAKKEVDEGLASSDGSDGEGMGAADDGAEDGGDKKGKKVQDSKASNGASNTKDKSKKLAGSASVATGPTKKPDLLSGSPKM